MHRECSIWLFPSAFCLTVGIYAVLGFEILLPGQGTESQYCINAFVSGSGVND
jgi:hypothetical protein